MPPLAIIPIGLYAITATLRAELALENAGNSAKEPEQKVTLTKTMVQKQAIDFAPKARANTSAFATNYGAGRKKISAKALKKQVEENKHQLVKKSGTKATEQTAKDDPEQYFP